MSGLDLIFDYFCSLFIDMNAVLFHLYLMSSPLVLLSLRRKKQFDTFYYFRMRTTYFCQKSCSAFLHLNFYATYLPIFEHPTLSSLYRFTSILFRRFSSVISVLAVVSCQLRKDFCRLGNQAKFRGIVALLAISGLASAACRAKCMMP